ncbi:putative LTP1-protein-tyrosine-phosphatase [Serendipita vermifera]|nr:putative LTP1-protein-tyrosine-phosphatase [Serendipita vermifera]
MGEAVLAHVAKQRGIDIHVESAGTAGYHVGEEPDERTVSTCKKHKVPIDHLAQQVERSHFTKFDYILASDNANLSALERMKPAGATAEVKLFSAWSDGLPIQDPYYGGMSGFEKCFTQCEKYSNALLDVIEGANADN